MNSSLRRTLLWAALVIASTGLVLAQDQLIVHITCRDGAIATLEPSQIDSLVLRSRGRKVEWELRTAGCPTTLKRVEIRFTNTSPFGEELSDKTLIVPELPDPLPESVSLVLREIANAGVHPYEVLFLDAEGKVLGEKEGRISARVLAPALDTISLIAAGLAFALLFWFLRRRLFANSYSA